MSEDRANALGGRMPQPVAGPESDEVDLPAVGKIKRGPTDLHTMHAYNRAVYDRLNSADRLLKHVRNEMDELVVKGDTVTPQDVMGAAGRLVGHGVPARELATLLSDMPQMAGQGLAAWLQAHDANVTQQELHVRQQKSIAAHRLGVSGVRAMAADDALEAHGRARAAARPVAQMAGQMAPQGGMPPPQVMQVAQAPGREGPGAEEAV